MTKRNKDKAAAQLATNEVDLNDPVRSFQAENFGVTIPVGSTYTFKIRENPTTGYNWSVTEESLANSEPYFTVKKVYKQNTEPGKEQYAGVGGQAFFTVTAVAPGSASLDISEARSWEKDMPND